jgi:4-amino-4-deoxy-L-arabinose transferase-like glycosyltransferase
VRLAFALGWDPPLLYTHQYNYYTNGLRIAEHRDPLGFVMSSDQWRAWVGGTTIAPLYYLLLGAFFKAFGPGLVPLRLFQAVLDALAAVATASLGRRLAGSIGLLAGVAYAVHLSAAEMICWTMTENLHTVLLAGSLALMAREATGAGSRPLGYLAGLLLGLSGLTRSVSSAFVPVAALWRLSLDGPARPALRRHFQAALFLLAGGLSAVFVWSVRNRMLGDKVPIETVGFYNLWDDNTSRLVPRAEWDRQLRELEATPTPGDYGRLALRLTARNILGNPLGFLNKVAFNFWHFVRPDGLYNLLFKEFPDPPWRHAAIILFDDLLLLVTLPLFGAFLLGGPPSPTRRLIGWWTAYYAFMVFVVFHAEARYRSALVPVAFAGAVAGVLALGRGESSSPRRWMRALLGFTAGVLVSLTAVARYGAPAVQALRSTAALRPAEEALRKGHLDTAFEAAARAAALAPESARPWRTFARLLAARDLAGPAADAYDRAALSRRAFAWPSAAVRPRLLQEAGRFADAEKALREALVLSWDIDPWMLLEVAWHELPPPRTDEVRVGALDYGAVRGFLHPRGFEEHLVAHRREIRRYDPDDGPVPPPGAHRWSRGTAWLRLRPTQPAATYSIVLSMGSPFPSRRPDTEVVVRINGGPARRVLVGPEVREYRFEAEAAPDGVVRVRLDTPTWGRTREPADQGVRVELFRVAPASR